MNASELDDFLVLLGELFEEVEAEYTNQQKNPVETGLEGSYE